MGSWWACWLRTTRGESGGQLRVPGPPDPPPTTLAPDLPPARFREGRALEVRVSDSIPLSQRGARRLVSVEPTAEQPEPDFRCRRGTFTLLWPSC